MDAPNPGGPWGKPRPRLLCEAGLARPSTKRPIDGSCEPWLPRMLLYMASSFCFCLLYNAP